MKISLPEGITHNSENPGIGRSERIRTSDPLLPKQVRYQAALRSDHGGRVIPFP